MIKVLLVHRVLHFCLILRLARIHILDASTGQWVWLVVWFHPLTQVGRILPSCHTDRWSATLNQDGTKGGVIIFSTPFRQVWGLADIERPIHPSDLHLPIGSSSVILTWTLDGSPIQSNPIDPRYWAAAQVCGVWVHRYVCAFVF